MPLIAALRKPVCPHECTCGCHDGKGKHAVACQCEPCALCGLRIRSELLIAHRERCHNQSLTDR